MVSSQEAPGNKMIYPFIFSSLTTLILGIALLLQWRRYPGAKFTRDMGIVYLTFAAVPVLYFTYTQATAFGQALALLGTFFCGVAFLTFLILGTYRLADRRFSWKNVVVVVFVVSLIAGYPLLHHDWRGANAVSGVIIVSTGLLAWRWLRASNTAERMVGPLLTLMGLIAFSQALWGGQAAAAQMTVNTFVRLLLGLVLLHTALQRANAEANRLRQQYERLTANSHQAVLVSYPDEIAYCNAAFLKIYGLASLAEATQEWIKSGMPAHELDGIAKLRQQVLDGSLADARYEGMRKRKDGTPLRLQFAIWRTEWNGRPALQTVITDETERHDTLAALLYQANHDELTGLPNRIALLRALREHCQQSLPDGQFGLVLLDIDRFKLFNDAHGHSLGDDVLKALAQVLERGLPEVAQLARLGSDGFAVLSKIGLDAAAIQALAQQVRELLSWPLVLPGQEFFVDVSLGIALYPQNGSDAETLLRAANAAMHEAKKVAGTSIVLAEERFVHGSGEVLEQEQALRAGILNREFSLAYQPKVDATSGALLGFEALARWQRGKTGAVNPMQFIAAAERTGLIGSLGMLLLSQVCEQLLRWREQTSHAVPVAVNVSPLQMHDPGFPQMVANTLKRYGIAPELITLEITESAAIGNMEQTQAQLTQLRDLGLKVAMDDFGTGFSSLDMLRRLPLNVVKIDRSLIEPMPAPDAVAVVQAICQLAAALKLRVVAEGVETFEQAQAAQQAGCHEIQGHFYARCLSPALALQWLEKAAVAPR